jgi:hypothetical protein
MVIRTYFDKNNTIQYNDLTNTGRNPVTELFYGGDPNNTKYSRFLFYFDESRIKEFYTGGTMPDLTKITHTLNLTNTSAFDEELLNQQTLDGKDRATSFDLILFSIDQDWDEGSGYDYLSGRYIGGVGNTVSVGASNWSEAQNNTYWSGGNGTYSGTASGVTIETIHFDKGNEHIELDITDTVNDYLTGGTTNKGLGLAFTRLFEETPSDDYQYVGFFTRHTQTFYEPYVETKYDNPIVDDRANFFLDKPNKLYLYVNLGGEATDLDSNPTVSVANTDGVEISGFTTSAVTHVTKGVYCIDLTIPTTTGNTADLMYTDTWSNLVIGGVSRSDVELDFLLKDSGCYYDIGTNESLPKKFGFTVSGIKKDERIIRGDIRRVNISARIPYTVEQKQVIDNLQYRLYVKEGKGEVTVIDYTDVNQTMSSNYFMLDTESLVPQTYYLDIKAISNGEVTTIKETINFDITSEVKYK